jgi:hypothetical protein
MHAVFVLQLLVLQLPPAACTPYATGGAAANSDHPSTWQLRAILLGEAAEAAAPLTRRAASTPLPPFDRMGAARHSTAPMPTEV